MWGMALGVWGQETDFSPYARFGLGTHQGLLSPGLASTVGLVSVTPDNVFLHADQPASAAGLANPTFQVSAHSQRMHLSEGERTSNAWTGGPGNMGLVVKKPRSNSALSLGLTPLTSKAFSVQRVAEDSLVGNLLERYEGTGGVARAHAGLSHGWRGKTWIQAGADSVLVTHRGLDAGAQVDHWFGDARQISTLDLEDASFRDVRTVTSFRHRAAGWILGGQGFQVLQAKYDENKQFKGSWVMRFGGTYSPARTLNTDYERLVQSTLPLGGVTTGIGAVINTAKAEPGCNAVVFGLGGIGLNVIQGLRMIGANMIIGVDMNDSKEAWGRQFGMTHFVNPSKVGGDLVSHLVEMTNGGADYSFECIGNVNVMRQALECCHKGWGESIIIGVAGAGQEIATRPFQLVTGRSWRGSAFGGARGRTDVPKIVEWYLDGKIQIDPMITHTMPLEDINKGFDLMHAGESIRSVVVY